MTDAPSIPPKMRLFGGSLHDWANTSLFVVLALLYVADCEGLSPGDIFGSLVLP